MEIIPVRKITTAAFGKIADQKERVQKKLAIFKVVGRCDSHTKETSTYGEYVRLYGDFLAISPDGTHGVRSDACILPNYLSSKIIAQLDGHINHDTGEIAPVEFSFELMTVPDKATKTGYTIVAEPLGRPEPAQDRLLMMAETHKMLPKLESVKK